VAFRQFSEKVVPLHCASILVSTLDHLDIVQDFIDDSLKSKGSFDFLEPVLGPLPRSLKMTETFYFTVVLTEEEIEEEKKRDQEEEEREKNNSLVSTSTELEREARKEIKRRVRMTNERRRSWTEENDSWLLLKYRLRKLEKRLATLQYVIKFAPDVVRQELEESGFVQQTKTLRKEVRSLLTCEGVSHITVAQLKDELGGFESDFYMDQNEARVAFFTFNQYYFRRLIDHAMESHSRRFSPTMPSDFVDFSQLEDCVPVANPLEGRQKWKDQVPEDCRPVANPLEERQKWKNQVPVNRTLFTTPEVKVVWTVEAIGRLWRATDKTPTRHNPELAAALFQE